MSGSSSRVPLVRCPKCGHLLPELPPYSVYCCGACGAYLRAEKGSRIEDTLSENSGDRTGEGSEKEMPAASNGVAKSVRSRYGGGAVRKSVVGESNLGDSDVHSKSSGRSLDGDGRKIPATESVGFKKSDEGRSMGSDDVVNYEEMEARKKVGAWFDNVNRDEWIGYDESAVNRARVSSGYGGRRGDHIIVDEIERDKAYVMRHEVPDSRHQDYGDGFRGNSQASSVRQRLPVYADEGPANYPSYYDYDRTGYSQEGLVGSSSLRNVEMNQAELYRLYHDLREKLTITGDLPVDSIRRGHHRVSSDGYVRDEPLRLRRPAASVDMDERARMSPHYMDRGRVPPSRFVPIEFSFDGDPSWSQIPGRAPPHRRHYPQRSSREYSAGHSVDSTYDRREGLHHPNCSCSLCHPRRSHEQAPAGVGYRSYPDSPVHTPPDFPDPHGLRASGTRFPYSISSRSRSSAETKSDKGGSTKEHKKRALVTNKNQLFCHPIAGAAPFLICYSCSQLLRLPKKLNAMKKTQVSLQCGSCRTVLSFDFSRKKSNVSTQLQPKPDPIDVYDEPIKTPEPDLKNAIDSSAGITTRESYDFDVSGYTFPSTESEPSMHLDNRIPNPNEAEKKQELRPSSSNASRDDLGSGNAVKKTDAPSTLMSNIPPRPPPGSSLQEHLDYSSIFSIKKVDEIYADVPDHDNGITDGDADGLAELVVNSNEVVLDMSRSSTVASINVDKGHKRGGSFFSSISGRSNMDLSPTNDALNSKINVFVNGQPLPHRAVRKAEKLAGPISPGNYWYDSRAGFWGIMGNCCLGIIPPFIEEFGFPIPKDCSSGSTSICVNGRELHEKDLDLLASRGFPRTRDKSYVIDISGKVEDEDTGDVVASLGKLAPTVEKTKRGFGMQPPEMQED